MNDWQFLWKEGFIFNIDSVEKDQRLKAVYPQTRLLPEVNVFQVAHSSQTAQIQTLHSIPSHGKLVHCSQSLQHSRDEGKVVEGQPQAA